MVLPEEEGPNSFVRSTLILRMFPSTVICTFFTWPSFDTSCRFPSRTGESSIAESYTCFHCLLKFCRLFSSHQGEPSQFLEGCLSSAHNSGHGRHFSSHPMGCCGVHAPKCPVHRRSEPSSDKDGDLARPLEAVSPIAGDAEQNCELPSQR